MKHHPLINKLDEAWDAHTKKMKEQPKELYLSSEDRKTWQRDLGPLTHRGVPIKSWDDYRKKK
jgi:hypothetical protein